MDCGFMVSWFGSCSFAFGMMHEIIIQQSKSHDGTYHNGLRVGGGMSAFFGARREIASH
jgi:hypothetical protein